MLRVALKMFLTINYAAYSVMITALKSMLAGIIMVMPTMHKAILAE
jgi:hypothetical protein